MRALEARQERRRPTLWLAASGVLFGLLALAHALTIWMFLGALIFRASCSDHLEERAGVPDGLRGDLFSWLSRELSGQQRYAGLSAYSLFYQIEGSESEIMRALQFSLHDFTPLVFRTKIQNQLILQFGQLTTSCSGKTCSRPHFFSR